jgi:hypothetical protein
MAALAAGVDDTGKQGEDPGADVGAGAVAEFADDHPVPQGTLSLVVGEREFRVGQNPENGIPVVEPFDGQGPGFLMVMVPEPLTGGAQIGQCIGVTGGQVGGGPLRAA